jgi:hypothetical protein
MLVTAGAVGLFTGSHGLLLCLLLGLVMRGFGYLAAPFVALVAEWDVWRATTRMQDESLEEAEAAA